MKLLKVLSLMIVLLLSCLKLYAQQINDSIPSTGGVQLSDTTVIINIGYIRLANAKMIERNYIIDMIDVQDSIISLKDLYIKEQGNVIADLKNRIVETNRINESVNVALQKQKTRTKIIGYSTGSAIICLIVGIIAK